MKKSKFLPLEQTQPNFVHIICGGSGDTGLGCGGSVGAGAGGGPGEESRESSPWLARGPPKALYNKTFFFFFFFF